MSLLPFALAAAVLIQDAPRPAGEVLRFNWPKDLTARVETQKTRERTSDKTAATTTKWSYRLRAVPHPEGMVIRYSDFKFDGVSASEVSGAAEMLSAVVPSVVVDRAGVFLRVEDIAPLRATMLELFRGLNKADELPPGIADVMSRLTSEEVLTSLAGQEWQQLVGAWQDLPVTPDKFEVDTEETSPVWPDLKIPMKVSGGMVEKGPCSRGGAKAECALFEMRSAVDQPTMQALMRRLLDGAKGMPAVQFETFDVVTVARIKLEIETMIPHSLTTTKTVRMSIVAPGEGRKEMKQVDRRTSRFEY